MAKGLSEIDAIIINEKLSSKQSAILSSLIFRFISQLLFYFFKQKPKKWAVLKEIKSRFTSLDVYPICLDYIPRQRLKIKLLNFSFNIFAFVFYLRETVLKLINTK